MKNGQGKCRKKLYDIWACMPPRETVIINKFEQIESIYLLKQRFNNKAVIDYTHNFTRIIKPSAGIVSRARGGDANAIQIIEAYKMGVQLAKQGIAYLTSDQKSIVLSGTMGEMWIIPFEKLVKTYRIISGIDGQSTEPITQQTLTKKLKNGCMDWMHIRTNPDGMEYYAKFVPNGKVGQVNSYGTMLTYNDPRAKHGKGDFLMCNIGPNGQPDQSDVWVVNGLVFALTYDNRGWSNEIDPKTEDIKTPQPVSILEGLKENTEDAMLAQIEQVLTYCKNNAIKQLPFNYKRVENKFFVKPTTIEDYSKSINKAAQKSEEEKKRVIRRWRFEQFITEIFIKDEKIHFNSYNITKDKATGKEKRNLVYTIQLPATDEGFNELRNNVCIYMGLSGYIQNGMLGNFKYTAKPSKYEYDGLEAYTISSSGINRKLRLQDYDDDKVDRPREDRYLRGYERVGSESQRLYRVIDGTDKYLEKSILTKPTIVFRGMSGRSAVNFSGSQTLENLPGHIITNTGYTSTSLNLHSTMMFANTGRDKENGVILAIELPAGTNAEYIHNIAGWKEQFEILLDRKYDIAVGQKLISVRGTGNFIYHIHMASLVEHVPFDHIPPFINTSYHKDVPNIEFYDEKGKINFTYEMIQGDMREAFHILKQKGMSGVQFQEKFMGDMFNRDYIVVRAGRNDDNTVTDLAFTYNNETNLLDIVKFISPEVVKDKDGKEITARNYWADKNRNNNAIDRNFVWETYNANNNAFTFKDDLNPDGNFQIVPKNSINLKGTQEQSRAEAIANTIIEYVKYNKDVTLLPMQDIARYMDSVFRVTVIQEGYQLKDSMAIERTGDPNNEEDGFCKMGYMIDGDDDDSLMIRMNLGRDEAKKLQMAYNGKSKDGHVNEKQNLRWNMFDQTVMERTCNKILYQFASKLKLNHTRKVDSLMQYVERLTGMKVVHHKTDTTGMNIHQKGNVKSYKLYTDIRTNSFILIGVNVKDRIANMRLRTATGQWDISISIDGTIHQMYGQFMESLKNGLATNPAQSIERKQHKVVNVVEFKNIALGIQTKAM